MKTIKLLNGQTIDINTKLSLGVLRRAQEDNLLSADFIKSILNMTMGTLDKDSLDLESVNPLDLINLCYVCYLNTDGIDNKLTQDEFLNLVPLEITMLLEIYLYAVFGNNPEMEYRLAESFKKVTPRGSGKSKKKHRH